MNALLTKQVLMNLSKRPDELPKEFAALLEDISQSYSRFQHSIESISGETQFLLDNIHLIFFSIDVAAGKTLHISKSCELVFGFSPNDFYNNYKLWLEIIPDEDKSALLNTDAHLKSSGPLSLKHRILHKDGTIKWLESKLTLTVDKNGTLIGIDGISAGITDITEKKLLEELRQVYEANLQTIFNHTDSSYILIDSKLSIVSFNKVAESFMDGVLGMQLADGKSIRDFWRSDRITFNNGVLDEVMAGEAVTYDTSYTLPDGTVRWYEEKWSCVNDVHNRFVGIVFSSINISERMKILQEHQQISGDLINRNKDLQQFTYLVSHYLRTPVANIMALAALLEDQKQVPTDLPELVDCILLSVQKLDEIIKDMNDILQVRKPACEKKEIVSFDQLMQTTKYALKDLLEKVHATLTCDFESVGYIHSIGSYLHSIFYTLILNSLKYRRSEIVPVITIRSAKHGNNIVLSFEDNGSGIDLERYKEQIFGIYQRFDFGVAGKGMGLFMLKTKIEQLGGSIAVESEVNSGTVFTVTLPI